MKYPYARAIFLAFALALSLLTAPAPCQAYCVYNHTDTKFDVCGENCQRCFRVNIKGGDHSCCPGNHKGCGGHTFITVWPVRPSDQHEYWGWYVPIQVTSHGWVSFFGSCTETLGKDQCDNLTAKVHNNDGHVIYDGPTYRLGSSWDRCKDD
jgi:hypothetical protein